MHVVKLAEERMPEGVREAFDRLQACRWDVARRGVKERLARLEHLDEGSDAAGHAAGQDLLRAAAERIDAGQLVAVPRGRDVDRPA